MTMTAETIELSGARLGGHAWLSMRLFETLGRWSGSADDPRAQVLFGSMSRRQGRHAELWVGLLPALPHLPSADLLSARDGADVVVAALASLDDSPASARLAALRDDALPHTVARYRAHLDVTVPPTDAPTIRALGHVLADLGADLEAVTALAGRSGGDAQAEAG